LELTRPDIDKINIERFVLESGRAILGVSEVEPIPSPVFNKIDEVKYSLKTQQFIASPILFKDDEIMFVVQLESKVIKKQNKHVGF